MSLTIESIISSYSCPEYESCMYETSIIVHDLVKHESKFRTVPKGTIASVVFGPVILSLAEGGKTRVVHKGKIYRAVMSGYFIVGMRGPHAKVVICLIPMRRGRRDILATVDGRSYRLIKRDASTSMCTSLVGSHNDMQYSLRLSPMVHESRLHHLQDHRATV
jgi:hypothetical protein